MKAKGKIIVCEKKSEVYIVEGELRNGDKEEKR